MKRKVVSYLTERRIPKEGFVRIKQPFKTGEKPKFKMHYGPGYHIISTIGEARREEFTPQDRWGEYAHARFVEDHVIRLCEAINRGGRHAASHS